MKDTLAQILVDAACGIEALKDAELPVAEIEATRDPEHGDFASNFALRLAKPARMAPRKLAEALVAALPDHDGIAKVEIAGPGFINFFLASDAMFTGVSEALRLGTEYGLGETRTAPRILVEFVSANPTGPLHVGHGRHAAFGDSVARILKAAGYPVSTEYYVNDAGRQMEILALSVLLRIAQMAEPSTAFPSAGYQGTYISDFAHSIAGEFADLDIAGLLEADTKDSDETKDAYIDAIIHNAQTQLGHERFAKLRRLSMQAILDDIEEDLAEFGVAPDNWFSEESLASRGSIDSAFERVRAQDLMYEKGGAQWFRATALGDEKDRVVVRDNGKTTYFASDIAYHHNKRERGFDHLLDILGSDHHGYIARVRAGLTAMGYEADSLEVELVQFVSLYRAKEKVAMSTRTGSFVTLRQLREEVGNDAARFFYVMRSNDQHLDFDLDLATSNTNENPVYYVQYAHARVASIYRQLAEAGLSYDEAAGAAQLGLLATTEERLVAADIAKFPEVIERAAERRAPHVLVNYLRELATHFHSLYNAHKTIVDDAELRNARLALAAATRQVIASGLALLGVSAPDRM